MNAIILLALLGVVLMMCSAFLKNTKGIKYVALVGLTVALLANIAEMFYGKTIIDIDLKGLLLFEQQGLLFNALVLFSTILYFVVSADEIEKAGNYVAEYFALICFVLCGIAVLTAYQNFLMLFIGIEIMSIPLYILTGSDKKNLKGNEAALKYFLMGAFSTGLMMLGIALIYGGTGTFALTQNLVSPIPSAIPLGASFMSFLDVAGMLILFASMLFKVSAAPFHFWAPDVYEGAPSVFTSFMATVVKVGAFVAFYTLFSERAAMVGVVANKYFGVDWHLLFSIVIVLTLLFGNITALFQNSVKRMLAYSSIAQAGFILFALFALNAVATEGLVLYALAYSLATIGFFAVLMKMKDNTFNGFNGLAKQQPLLALTATICLLSLAGIPLTAGFFAKYYMLMSALQVSGYLWLVIVAVIFAAISVVYYFKVIQAMYFKEGNAELTVEKLPKLLQIGLVVIAILIIFIGIFPYKVLGYLYF